MARLVFRTKAGANDPPCCSVDGHVTGLREATAYLVEVELVKARSLFVDDIELPCVAPGSFEWASEFFAGEVAATLLDDTGREHAFRLDVSPSAAKLGSSQLQVMLDDIRQYDSALLLGASSAALSFGRQGQAGRWDLLVRLARLRRYGPPLLAATAQLTRNPQQFLQLTERPLPLRRVRRLHPSALRNPRVAALLTTGIAGDQDTESLQLHSLTPEHTVDTPANSALKALLSRFKAAALALSSAVEAHGLPGDRESQSPRRSRRLVVLRALAEEAERLLQSHPFPSIRSAETTAAGLTQVAAQPHYARAYRLGTQALRLGAAGEQRHEDQLLCCPSWGVYETWCFVEVARALEEVLGGRLSAQESSTATADIALVGKYGMADVELLFQAVFRAGQPSKNRVAWSVSAERRPDIVVVWRAASGLRLLVLDAKYRSGRDNVLDAMTSAHIYQDALRLGSERPDMSLLLLPGEPAVPDLECPKFWAKHRVGTLSQCAVSQPGRGKLGNLLRSWLRCSGA